MALTWKWSTNKGKLQASANTSLLAKPKKKKGFLERTALKLWSLIKGPALSAWDKLSAIATSPEATALWQTLSSPGQVISQWLKETSKASGRLWDSLSAKGKIAEDSGIPLISQAWSITRAAWGLISGPEATRKKVIEIRDNVRDGKINMFDWLLEWATTTWLQGITTIAAPFLQAINSWLNATWLDEPLDKSIQSWTNFLVDLTSSSLWISKEKAQSRVNSWLNVLRGLTMYKWGQIINKWWAWNFVKGSTLISSPDIALSTLAFAAKEEGKPMPESDKIKWLVANSALAFIPAPKGGKKVTTPKIDKSLTEAPKLKLSEILDEPTVPKGLEVKKTEKVKKSLEAEKALTEKPKAKLSEILEEPTVPKKTEVQKPKKISTKNEILSLEKQKVNLEKRVGQKPALKAELNKVNSRLKELKDIQETTKPTERLKREDVFAEEAPVKVETPAVIKKQPKFTKKRIKSTKELVQNIVNEKREARAEVLTWEKAKIDAEKALVQKNRMDEILDTADTFTEKELVDNVFADNILTDESKINLVEAIEAKKTILTDVLDDSVTPKTEKTPSFVKEEWIFDDSLLKYKGEKAVQWEKAHLDVTTQFLTKIKADRVKDFLIDNLDWFLKTIKFTDKEGNRTDLSDKIASIDMGSFNRIWEISKELGFDTLKQKVESNTAWINKWFDYVQSNYKNTIDNSTVEWRLRIWNVEDSINNSALFAKTTWVQWKNFSKFSVITNYIFWNIRSKIEWFKQEELDRITKWKKLTPDQLEEIKSTIEITDKDIEAIRTEEIAKAPQEVQWLLNDTFDNHSQFKEGTTMRQGNDKIGQELVDLWLLPWLKENYTHGYITYDMLKRYADETKWGDIKALAKEFWIELRDIENLNWADIVPENISWILKKKADVWALHSQDPLSVMYSYASEVASLLWRKEKLDIINFAKNSDPKVKSFLSKHLPSEDNYKLKRILNLGTQGVFDRATRPVATGLSYLFYVANPSLILQNAAFAWLKWATKIASDLALNEGKYGTTRLISENNSINDYLFNQWLLSHKITDINKTIWGNVPRLQKAAWVAKKITFNEALKQSTSFTVWQWQSLVAWAYMNKVIKDNWFKIQKWDTLVWTFEKALEWMTEKERLDVSAKLKQSVDYIENTSWGSESSTKALTNPIQGMVKMFSRGQISKLAFNVTDIIDAVNSKFKQWKDVKVGKDISRNAIHLAANLSLYLAAYKIIANTLFDTEEEKEKFTKYMYGENVTDVLLGYAWNKLWLPWVNMLLKEIDTLMQWGVEAFNTEGDIPEVLLDTAFKMAVWIDKWRDALGRLVWDKPEPKETLHGSFKFTDAPSTWGIIWEIMGINPQSAWYEKASNAIFKEGSEISDNFSDKVYSVLNPIIKLGRKVTEIQTWITTREFRTEIDNMNRRIKEKEGEVLTSEEFLFNALAWETWELSEKNKKELIQSFLKTFPANRRELAKINSIIKEVEWQKNVDKEILEARTKDKWPVIWDFNNVLEQLRVKNPVLYRKFYGSLYNIKNVKEGQTQKIQNAQQLFIDFTIWKDMGGKFLWSWIANSLNNLNKKLETKRFSEKGLIIDDYDKLRILDETLELIPEQFRESIKDSLSWNINISINNKNAANIMKAVEEFPQIHELYRRAAELRWATFAEDVDKGIDKTEEISNIPTETKLSEKITTNWTNLWTQVTSSETKKKRNWKLIDLIDLETPQQTQPKLKKVNLQTLLDKVI